MKIALLSPVAWRTPPRHYGPWESVVSWILERQTAAQGHLSLLGNEKLMERGGGKAQFDQQPIEAMALVQACAEAYYVTGDKNWLEEAERCFRWFLGYNDVNQELYDFKSGACFDGIGPMGVNLNQGAESTLSFLLSLLTMYEIARKGLLKGSGEVV